MTFDMDAVEASIADTQFAGSLQHFASVASTNTLALEAAQAGARSGVWVADEQTAGRGRGNHGWHSAAGDGLYVSVLIAPTLPASDALRMSLSTGLAAKTAIAEITGISIDIRWPNDLLIDSRKCGGVLVETAIAPEKDGSPAMLRYAVIGVGINLNHAAFPKELTALATSLRIEMGEVVPREALLASLLKALDSELCLLMADTKGMDHRKELLKRFSEASTWAQGKRVHVNESGGYTGVTAGLDAGGFLQVDADDGRRRTVLSGGVREL